MYWVRLDFPDGGANAAPVSRGSASPLAASAGTPPGRGAASDGTASSRQRVYGWSGAANNASRLAVAIRGLQTERAFQTVANEVAVVVAHVARGVV